MRIWTAFRNSIVIIYHHLTTMDIARTGNNKEWISYLWFLLISSAVVGFLCKTAKVTFFVENLHDYQSQSKIRPWDLRDSEPRMTVLARTSSNLPDRPLHCFEWSEGSQNRQTVQYGHESHGTRNQGSLFSRGPTTIYLSVSQLHSLC
jgi:hypothetical protein